MYLRENIKGWKNKVDDNNSYKPSEQSSYWKGGKESLLIAFDQSRARSSLLAV